MEKSHAEIHTNPRREVGRFSESHLRSPVAFQLCWKPCRSPGPRFVPMAARLYKDLANMRQGTQDNGEVTFPLDYFSGGAGQSASLPTL